MALKYIEFIFKFPKFIATLLLTATCVSAFLFTQLPVETSVESLIMENDPDLIFYETFKEQFGEDEFVIVAFSAKEIFTPQLLNEIDRITKQLEKINEVKEVVSITNVETIFGTDKDFIVAPLCETLPENDEQALKIKKRALGLKSIKNNIISKNGKSSLFLIRTKSHPDDEKYDLRILNNISDVFLKNKPHGSTLHLDKIHIAGWLVTDVNMSRYINEDNMVFMPLIYLIIGLFLYITLRNVAGVVIGLSNVSVCLLWTMAALYLTGGAISPMTAILTPLILALSVSDSVHMMLKFFQSQTPSRNIPEALKIAINDLWKPCFLTSMTTAIGFLSLLVSNIPPIRQFGLAAALGMMMEFVLTMTLIPLIIYFLQDRSFLIAKLKPGENKGPKFEQIFSNFVETWKYLILFCSVILIGISIFGISKIKVETNLIEYFKKDSQIYKDFSFIDENLSGVNTLEISFQSIDSEDIFRDPVHLEIIEKTETFIKTIPGIETTTSVNTFIKQMNQSFNNENTQYYSIPDSKQMIAQYLLLYGGDELYNFLNEDFSWTRISARIAEHNSTELKKYIAQIQDFIEQNFKDTNMEIRVTGKTFLVNKLVKSIVDSQVNSLLLAFLIIFIILFIVFKSLKLGFISLIPNSLPIVFNLGIMGLLHIPLNTATAIISAVAIGIAVDDTIHYLTVYQDRRDKGIKIGQAALEAIHEKGRPIFMTSVIISFGFGIMIFSNFVPTIQFGFLSSLIMLSAMVCDLILLPALFLSSFKS